MNPQRKRKRKRKERTRRSGGDTRRERGGWAEAVRRGMNGAVAGGSDAGMRVRVSVSVSVRVTRGKCVRVA